MWNAMKTQLANLRRGGLLFNDSLWLFMYIAGGLISFHAIADEYNVSRVADTNPIRAALACGFYLVCCAVLTYACVRFRFLRIGIVELVYVVVKLIVRDGANASFSLLLMARLGCVAICLIISFLLARASYARHRNEWIGDSFCPVGIILAILLVVAYVVFNLEKVFELIGGGMLAAFIMYRLATMGPIDFGDFGYRNQGRTTSYSNDTDSSGISTSNTSSERISFSNYDISRGDIAKDFDRIDF